MPSVDALWSDNLYRSVASINYSGRKIPDPQIDVQRNQRRGAIVVVERSMSSKYEGRRNTNEAPWQVDFDPLQANCSALDELVGKEG